jgi:hypothetical protein
MARVTYVYDPVQEKMVVKGTQTHNNLSATVQGFKDFKSPIDGSIIGDRKQLAAHNLRHGVTNIADYGEQHFHKKGMERREILDSKSETNRRGRREELHKQFRNHGNEYRK